MQFSVEILDHVFSYLVSHRETLIACSKDPALYPIVERHLYHHVVVNIGPVRTDGDPDWREAHDAFEPKRLSELVSKRPRIIHYVRILEIKVNNLQERDIIGSTCINLLDQVKHLLIFPDLECIIITISERILDDWYSCHAVLKDWLSLQGPTVKEIRSNNCPISIFGNCENIKHLTLSGVFEVTSGEFGDPPSPRLKSLALDTHYLSSSILAWVKLHINELQSLKCGWSSMMMLPELLGVCSETLKELEIDFWNSPFSSITPFLTDGLYLINHLPKLSHIPKILQQLTIRTAVEIEIMHDTSKRCVSSLLVAAEAINLLISSPRLGHLILDIDIDFLTFSQVDIVDFTPLAVLGPASLSIPRIDLYVHTAEVFSDDIHAHLLSFLGQYEDVMRSIKEDKLVIHSKKTAPNAWL